MHQYYVYSLSLPLYAVKNVLTLLLLLVSGDSNAGGDGGGGDGDCSCYSDGFVGIDCGYMV